jgi:DnaJ family protein A protein 2
MFGGIPFEHFAGGFPGGGGGSRGVPKDVDTSKLYETLEVPKTATTAEIKKAYRNLSRVHHPDKGGDEHKFKEINAAYEILSDPDERAKYDKYGLEGVSDESGRSGGEDLFSMFFGGRGGGADRGPRKGPSIQHPLKVSLEDLYNGKTVKLAINRKVIVGDVSECTKCNGRGMILEVRQLGPGMIQQMQRSCSECNGQGTKAESKNERKIVEVLVEKGMINGQKITFRGLGDEVPKMEPGDIHFIVQEKEHSLFKRKGADLLLTKEVSLNQALCGFSWKIRHLDGRQLIIKTRPGEVIKPEANTTDALPFVKIIPDEGMPSRGNPFIKGNLYILFRVRFPEDGELSDEQRNILRNTLPDADLEIEYDAQPEGSDDVIEEVHMQHADVRQFGKGGAKSSDDVAYDSDEEEEGGRGRPVQCAQS